MKKLSIILLLMLFTFVSNNVSAQLNSVIVTVQIVPPYSPYLSTYVDQPNKVLLSLQNISGVPQDLKLWVKISGDNGVSLTTSSSFNPAQPIHLDATGIGAIKNISFNSDETRDYFDVNNVTVTGITKAQLIQNQALPEGNYTICVHALDHASPYAQKSMDGCTTFPLFYIDPPVAIQPVCGSSLTEANPQFLLFTWSPPATAPGAIQYEFTLKEVPNNLNPNDVIKNNVFPVLYNTTITAATTLAYTVAFPQLETGKKYVWRVKAEDPSNSVQFKNGGYSDACTFTYKSNAVSPVINLNPGAVAVVNDIPAPVVTNTSAPLGAAVGGGTGGWGYVPMVTEGQGDVFIPPFIQTTTLNGNAKYVYPESSSKYPLKKATLRLLVGYQMKNSSGQNLQSYSFNTNTLPGKVGDGEELAVTTTDEDGNFSFNFLATFPFGKVSDNFTSGSGEFQSTGELHRYAYIVIEKPHAEFYAPRFTGIYTPANGELLNIGDITTTVNSTKLKIKVKHINDLFDETSNTSDYVAGANVYLCRKKIYSNWQKMYYPQEDGKPDNAIIDQPAACNGLDIIAKGETNSSGSCVFSRVVNHINPNFRYYIYVDMPKDASGFTNYSPVSGPVERTYSCPGGFLMCDQYEQTVNVETNMPRVSGWVEDEFDGKRVPAWVFLKSWYIGNDDENIWGSLDNKEESIKKKMADNTCPCNGISTRLAIAGKDGRFEFLNQPIQIKTGTVKAIGPSRSLQCYAPGYDDITYQKVKSPLLEGEQAFVKLSVTRGATIKGQVVDGETGKPVSSQFYFVDELKSGYTYSSESAALMNYFGFDYVTGDGRFKNYPAKKMGITQKLVFKSQGYITDTLSVVVNQKEVDLGVIKLYTLKRRVRVKVLDAVTHNMIKDATVILPDVKEKCMLKQGSGPYQALVEGECPIIKSAPLGITPIISFENAGGTENNNQFYKIKVVPPDGTEYVLHEITATIPYASKPKDITIYLEPGTCVSGYVYAGKTNTSPVEGAKVKVDIMKSYSWWGVDITYKDGEGETTTDASGKYTLHRVPLRSYGVMMRAIKSASQFVGDSFTIVTDPKGSIDLQMGGAGFGMPQQNKPLATQGNFFEQGNSGGGDNCKHHDFHLSVYNDMDITSLMGFPIAVTELNPKGSSAATVSGYFEKLPDNAQFKAKGGNALSFSNVDIVPGTLKNAQNIPVSQPSITPVKTNNNELPLSAYGIDGKVEDKNLGIYLDKTVGGSQYGVLKGKVKLSATEFNQTVIGLTEDVYLTLPAGSDKMKIPVFNADKTVTNPANVPSGFGVANVDGNALAFSLPGFYKKAKTDLAGSKFTSTGEVQLATKLETNIANITPANLNLDLGIVKLKKGVTPVINTSQPISFKLGEYWTVNSTDWKLDANGLKMNSGKLNTGVEFPISNIVVQYDKLITNATQVNISAMKLAKVHPVNITSNLMSFGEIIFSGNKKVWQVYVAPSAGNTCGNITNLPGMAATDKVNLHSINLFSNGQKNIFMKQSNLTLRNILPYHTDDMTSMLLTDENFNITGTFDLNIPDKHNYAATLSYDKNGSTLSDLNLINVAPVVFNHPSALGHVFTKNHSLTNGMFKVSGTAEEPGVFPKTNTTLYYTADSVSVWVNAGQNIPISGERMFDKAIGGMRIEANKWTPFWFDGEVKGMSGVSDVLVNGKPQRMKFIVEGEISADGQSITMSDVSTPFGNMSWTYKFPQSQLVGHCDIDMNLGSLGLVGGITSVVDGAGWYFQADGQITIPGVGAADVMGIFGNYSKYPEYLATGVGDIKCLPSAFTGQVNGFMFQAGIHKQVVPGVSFEIPTLLSVDFGVDLGLTTRVWRSFGASSQYGISLLAKGHAYASGSCEATCSTISADADAQVGISGVYNPGDGSYGVTGCASVGFEMNVSQCLGALGLCGPCVTVPSGHKDVAIKVSYSKANGAKLHDLEFKSCAEQCD